MPEIEKRHFDKSFLLNVKKNGVFVYRDGSIYTLNPTSLRLDQIWEGKFGRVAHLGQSHICEQLYDRNSKAVRVGCYNRHDGNELWKIDFHGHRYARNIAGKLFITDINFTYFICLNLDTGKESWTYSFPEGEKVAGDIYLYEGVLVVPSMAGQAPDSNDYLRGINVESGELLWKRDGSFQYYQLERSSGYLYGFAHGLYEVTDIESGEKLVDKKLTNDLWVSQHMNSLGDGGLYFVDGTHTNMGMFISKFGKINTETHEIEFIQKLDVAEGVKAEPPIYHKGRLYIKDSMDVLHIYEESK
ncbi:PQQ-binding-like beta-propeller repeat protein [Galbibacter sp. EGI 63066]|uniref:outer membrane protein assembly factor BamB family protein n=1 Tax=Galbibacter sp. EGI 63066 TaxID=2993559 RepID=UPI00224947AF|nr:PQQ-binding-like beta-propeller repeat protein [Galbibacter sp. EGI 63066]MCX2682124.1 PQQ-binding-like beta-propeller repeat protein [Galbibacter sp. EGI 63066]